MFLTGIFAAALGLATASTATAAVFYECDIATKKPRGWVSPKIGFVFDDAGQVTVIDSVILNFLGEPLVAKLNRNGAKNRITWAIAGATDSKGQRIPTFRYVARLNTDSKTVAVIAKPTGAPQSWRGKGTCRIRKGGGGIPKLR